MSDATRADVIGKYEAAMVVKRFVGDEGMSSGLRHFSTRTLEEFLTERGRIDEKLIQSIYARDGYTSKARLLKEVLIEAHPRAQLRILKALIEEVEIGVYQRGPDALREAEDEVKELVERLEERPVEPEGSPVPEEDVWQIIETAETLITEHGPEETVDRLHTALHGHTRHLCQREGIELEENASLTRVFKRLRQEHPVFEADDEVASPERVLHQLGGVLHQLNEARNNKSRAHPNKTLPPEDARLFVDAATTVFNYINRKVEAYERD